MITKNILLAIALAGVILTGYLTYAHYAGQLLVCPLSGNGCDAAMQSHYAYFLGLPVALLGVIGWLAILWSAYNAKLKQAVGLSLAGIIAAGYFNGIMLKLGTFCIYCETAHALMIAFFLIVGYAVFQSTATTIVTAGIAFIIPFASISMGPATSMTTLAVRDSFVKCLAEKGVVMYGAYWCPHCKEQKELFGTSFEQVAYVECADPENPRQQAGACREAHIDGYPTWIKADGKRLTGVQSIDALAQWSDCQ